MAVTNPRVGAAILISIGRPGQKPDLYPARITGQAQMVVTNGRAQQLAPCIVARKNLAGEAYLAERIHNLAFAFDRKTSDRVVMLDGTAEQPKTWQELVSDRAAAALAFLASLPETGQVVEIDELPV